MILLDDLVEKSIYIIREANAKFENIAVLWSTGKDSTTLLSLIREAFFGTIPFPVIHIDTGFHFQELLDFRDQIASDWKLELIIAKSNSKIKKIPKIQET